LLDAGIPNDLLLKKPMPLLEPMLGTFWLRAVIVSNSEFNVQKTKEQLAYREGVLAPVLLLSTPKALLINMML
jgi:hypothetical protein